MPANPDFDIYINGRIQTLRDRHRRAIVTALAHHLGVRRRDIAAQNYRYADALELDRSAETLQELLSILRVPFDKTKAVAFGRRVGRGSRGTRPKSKMNRQDRVAIARLADDGCPHVEPAAAAPTLPAVDAWEAWIDDNLAQKGA